MQRLFRGLLAQQFACRYCSARTWQKPLKNCGHTCRPHESILQCSLSRTHCTLVIPILYLYHAATLANGLIPLRVPQFPGHQHPWYHDDVLKWKYFPRYWPIEMEIHRWPVDSPRKAQWRGALVFSLICTPTNGWANNGGAGDLRRHHAHYEVTVMIDQALHGCSDLSTSRIIAYRKTSSIRRTKSQNVNVYCFLLQWCLPNPLRPGVKLRMKM